MRIFRSVVTICCFCFVLNGSLVFPQSAKQPIGKPVPTSAADKKKDTNKVKPGDSFPRSEIKSPFRYVIVDSDLQFDDEEEKVPVRRFVTVLMEKEAFNEGNLIFLFKYLSNYYTDPVYLNIEVHTSLMTLQTPQEGAAASSRDEFRRFHRTASYSRFNDGSEGFLYNIGKPGKFSMKYVRLTTATRSK